MTTPHQFGPITVAALSALVAVIIALFAATPTVRAQEIVPEHGDPSQVVEIPEPVPAPDTNALRASLAAGRAFWGGDPPCGRPVVRMLPDWYGGYALEDICTIDIGEHELRDFDFLCNLVVHELGHLRGLGHGQPGDVSYDPTLEGTVMDYRVSDEDGTVPACDRERRRRERLEERWFGLVDRAVERRALCRKLRRRHAAAAPRRCRQAAASTARARHVRRAITWGIW